MSFRIPRAFERPEQQVFLARVRRRVEGVESLRSNTRSIAVVLCFDMLLNLARLLTTRNCTPSAQCFSWFAGSRVVGSASYFHPLFSSTYYLLLGRRSKRLWSSSYRLSGSVLFHVYFVVRLLCRK